MKEIVESTGLSKGAFYHYFPSKESLFLEIVETYFRMLHIDFDKFSKDSFYRFYHDYIVCSFKNFMRLKEFLEDTDDEDDLTYITLTLDAINLFPGFKEQVDQLHDKELSAWEDAVRSGLERGEIKSTMSPALIAKLFVYAGDGIAERTIMQGRIRYLQYELSVLWDGLYNDLKA